MKRPLSDETDHDWAAVTVIIVVVVLILAAGALMVGGSPGVVLDYFQNETVATPAS